MRRISRPSEGRRRLYGDFTILIHPPISANESLVPEHCTLDVWHDAPRWVVLTRLLMLGSCEQSDALGLVVLAKLNKN